LKDKVKTPTIPHGFHSSWAQYTIALNDKEQRETVQATLNAQGIPSRVYYPKPMHAQQAFESNTYDGSCPVTEKLCSTVLALPMHPYLKEEQVELVASTLLKAL